MTEPLCCLGLPPGSKQHLRVCVVQTRGSLATGVRRGAGILQSNQGGVELPHVDPCAGLDDPELHKVFLVKHPGLVATSKLNGALRAFEATLTVGHHREQARTAGDTSSSAKLTKCLRPLRCAVRQHTEGLANDANTASSVLGGTAVGQRQLRIIVDEEHCGDKVFCHSLGVGLVETAKIATNLQIEVRGFDVLGQCRLIGASCRSSILPRSACLTVLPKLPVGTVATVAGVPTIAATPVCTTSSA